MYLIISRKRYEVYICPVESSAEDPLQDLAIAALGNKKLSEYIHQEFDYDSGCTGLIPTEIQLYNFTLEILCGNIKMYDDTITYRKLQSNGGIGFEFS